MRSSTNTSHAPNRRSGEPAAKQAYFPRIVWHIIPDAATAGAALQNNEIDWWEQPLADLLPKLAADKNLALQVDQPWGRISWLILNQAQPPFNDVRLRRAVMMAARQDDYMRATFGDDQSLWRVEQGCVPVRHALLQRRGR